MKLLQAPRPLVIAHRGFSRAAPENTLAAFREALDTQADLVELDYGHSRDGTPVVLHDDTLDRTTDAASLFSRARTWLKDLSLRELARLDAGSWFHPRFAGERLPTLHEAIATILPASVPLIERKGGEAGSLIRLLEQNDWIDRVVVQSFDWPFLRECRELSPSLALGILGPPPSTLRGKIMDRREIFPGPELLGVVEDLNLQVIVWNRQVTPDAAAEVHRRGRKLWVYTIDRPAEARRLVKMGVDGIITNDPAIIRAAL